MTIFVYLFFASILLEASLKEIICFQDYQLIKKIGNLEIELNLENNIIEENNYPDWFGFKRIENI